MKNTLLKSTVMFMTGVFLLSSCTQDKLQDDETNVRPDAVKLDFTLLDPEEPIVIDDILKDDPISIEKGALDRGRYNITLRYIEIPGLVDPPTARQVEVFEDAVARWQRIIIKDEASIGVSLPSGIFGYPAIPGPIDDIVIEVVLFPIDGPFGTLGFAGPRFIRTSNSLPVTGIMVFDTADLELLDFFDLFEEVIVHEMGHVLGIGTIWDNLGLIGGPVSDPYFTGRKANVFWNAEGGEDELPIENIGGPGTALGHWREASLNNELMTGFLNLGENPLSRITAGSMRDLGYGSSSVGESYDLPRGTPGVIPGDPSVEREGLDIGAMEELLLPIGFVNDN